MHGAQKCEPILRPAEPSTLSLNLLAQACQEMIQASPLSFLLPHNFYRE